MKMMSAHAQKWLSVRMIFLKCGWEKKFETIMWKKQNSVRILLKQLDYLLSSS